MIRLLACFFYMCGYLIYSVPHLIRMKKLDQTIPVAKRDEIVHSVPKMWSRTIMRITGSQITVEGEERIPSGPVVLVSNHEGDFDVPVLLGFIKKPFGFVSKIEVKKVPIISAWMEAINCVFLDRSDRRQAVKSIREGIDLIKHGHSMIIFPEGTRSKGGPVAEFKSGSLKLAKEAGVPLVPISIKGTANVFEKNNRLIRPAHIHVIVGEPIFPDNYSEKNLKELTTEVRNTIVVNLENNQLVS
ncbi:lysophospholipid acyltransferase family protein [Bacillus rubiinfantis]|uniref:lysophospholipid acyltransferase family protein n=1 Tax=Bacillus rubiinfantis TaxID=1499680 RepID=UPI0005AB451F|nr:lysophospholipid acyltransferase family protein [Bacillus rubiinfantis]